MVATKEDVQRLRLILICPKKSLKVLLKKLPKSTIKCISECCLNTLKGNIPITAHQKRKLARHKHTLRKLSDKKVSFKKKRKLIIQKGGFLYGLLPIAISILSNYLTK
nr:TPA_asm: gasderminX [Parasteatoda house spider adintovirus]